MKKIIIIILSFFTIGISAQIKISDLPAASAIGSNDLFPLVQNGATKKLAYSIIDSKIRSLLLDSVVTNVLKESRRTTFPSPATSGMWVNYKDTPCFYTGIGWLRLGKVTDTVSLSNRINAKLNTSTWIASIASKITAADTVKWNAKLALTDTVGGSGNNKVVTPSYVASHSNSTDTSLLVHKNDTIRPQGFMRNWKAIDLLKGYYAKGDTAVTLLGKVRASQIYATIASLLNKWSKGDTATDLASKPFVAGKYQTLANATLKINKADSGLNASGGYSTPTNLKTKSPLLSTLAATSSKGLLMGNSTSIAYLGYNGIEYYLLTAGDVLIGTTCYNQSVPGNTILQQQTIWTADANKATYDWIIVETGLNDMDYSESAATALGRLQTLINTINSGKKSTAIVIIATMTPDKGRLLTLYGTTNGATAYQKWLNMNTAIMGGGANAITGVNGRINNHTSLLSDANGYLLKIYDYGDGIHENNYARSIIAGVYRQELQKFGFLTNELPLIDKPFIDGSLNAQYSTSDISKYPIFLNMSLSPLLGLAYYPQLMTTIGQTTSDLEVLNIYAPMYSSAGVQKTFEQILSTNKDISDAGSYQTGIIQSTTASTIFSCNKDAISGAGAGVPLIFKVYSGTTGIEGLHITSDPFIGLAGQTTPKFSLDINGSARIRNRILLGGNIGDSTTWVSKIAAPSGIITTFTPRVSGIWKYSNVAGTYFPLSIWSEGKTVVGGSLYLNKDSIPIRTGKKYFLQTDTSDNSRVIRVQANALNVDTTHTANGLVSQAQLAAATNGMLVQVSASYNASGGYPTTGSGTTGAIVKGDYYYVTTPGKVGNDSLFYHATLLALVNNPGTTRANWNINSAGGTSTAAQTAGSPISGTLAYTGRTKTNGAGYGGSIVAPSHSDSTYNFDGNFRATTINGLTITPNAFNFNTANITDTSSIHFVNNNENEGYIQGIGKELWFKNGLGIKKSLSQLASASASGGVQYSDSNIYYLKPWKVANLYIHKADSTGSLPGNYVTDKKLRDTVNYRLTGKLTNRGNWDASTNQFPSSSVLNGDWWTITVKGCIGGTDSLYVGSIITAKINTPGQTVSNWNIITSGGTANIPVMLKAGSSGTGYLGYKGTNGVAGYLSKRLGTNANDTLAFTGDLLVPKLFSPLIYGGSLKTNTLSLSGNSATATGTNIAGGEVNLYATPGTGTGVSGFHFFTGTTLTTGSTLQTSSEKMTLLGNGNVGIGTTTPAYKLDVNGAINSQVTGTGVTSNTSYANFTAYNPQNGYPLAQFLVGQNTSDANAQMYVSPLFSSSGVQKPAMIGVSTNKNAIDAGNRAFVMFQTTSLAYLGTYLAGNSSLSATPIAISPGAFEAMRILTNGNVGIGTTAPTNILSLGNTQAQTIWIEPTATDVVGRALTIQAGNTVAGTSVNDVVGGNLILSSGAGTGAGASSISFNTGTTLASGKVLQTLSTKMTILGNGNVGIGNTSPQFTADINGKGRFRDAVYWGGPIGNSTGYRFKLDTNMTITPRVDGAYTLLALSNGTALIGLNTSTHAVAVTGAFSATTVNGLTITANNTNTLNIAAGKILAVTNSLTLSGTDGTTMTFPSVSGTVSTIQPYDTLNPTDAATIYWDCKRSNRTETITGSKTLKFYNMVSGMFGDLKLTVSSGTPTLTLPSGGGLLGSAATLAAGNYHLCWRYDGSHFDFSIQLYTTIP